MKKKKFSLKVIKLDENEMVFDMYGTNFPFANAIRRILLSEVPTMAIEKIHLYNNTSVMHDEFLGLRLGLIPIKADPNDFEYYEEDGEDTEENTIKFKLDVCCPPNSEENLHVYSKDLIWEPIDNQAKKFKNNPIRPVDGDILITKLSPSQKIEAILHCRKGIGKDHAKFSPVSGCYYRYLTSINLNSEEPLTEEEIEKLKVCFPKNHLDFNTDDGQPVVTDSRLDTSDLTFMSCPTLKKKILINTNKDILVFTVESTGALPPNELVLASLDILKSKCTMFVKTILKNKPR